jgi:hypothetical protein
MRWRSLRLPTASISRTADGLISSLYLATALEFPDHILEWQVGLADAVIESLEVFRVFGQRGAHHETPDLARSSNTL